MTDVSCEFHGNQFLVEDYSSGNVVCNQCGLVLVERAICELPDWRSASLQRCVIEDPENREIIDRIRREYTNASVQIKKYKERYESFIDMFYDTYHGADKNVVEATKNNFLTFKKHFSNVDLEMLVCAVVYHTLEFFGCVVTLKNIIKMAPRLSTYEYTSSLVGKITKYKRKMDELCPENEFCRDYYFSNFVERLVRMCGEKIITKSGRTDLLEQIKTIYAFISSKININSKRPLQAGAVLAAFYALERFFEEPKDLLKILCSLADIREQSINYWLQKIKELKIFQV